MSADYQYTTIPALIRDALGDDVEIREYGLGFAILGNPTVEVKPMFHRVFGYLRDPEWKSKPYAISLSIDGYKKRVGLHAKHLTANRRVTITDGKLDLDVFRAKYAEVMEAWKPHEAAIEARTAELEAEAQVKAQEQRYIDAGPDLVEALEWVVIVSH